MSYCLAVEYLLSSGSKKPRIVCFNLREATVQAREHNLELDQQNLHWAVVEETITTIWTATIIDKEPTVHLESQLMVVTILDWNNWTCFHLAEFACFSASSYYFRKEVSMVLFLPKRFLVLILPSLIVWKEELVEQDSLPNLCLPLLPLSLRSQSYFSGFFLRFCLVQYFLWYLVFQILDWLQVLSILIHLLNAQSQLFLFLLVHLRRYLFPRKPFYLTLAQLVINKLSLILPLTFSALASQQFRCLLIFDTVQSY